MKAGTKDYSDMLEVFIKEVNTKKPIIMGHSFGGRVAIRYSSNNPIEKLVLFGSPCIRHEKKLPLSTRILKGIKKLHAADVESTDLRGGASLVLAGLVAKGTTTVGKLEYLLRGYENFDKKLNELGANIIRNE